MPQIIGGLMFRTIFLDLEARVTSYQRPSFQDLLTFLAGAVVG